MSEKDNTKTPVETPEKKVENTKRANKIIMAFIGIMVVALIISLFTGGKSTPPSAPANNGNGGGGSGQYQDADGFSDASSNTATSSPGSKKPIHKWRHGYTTEPAAWQKKEVARALDSRRVGFGFEVKRQTASQGQSGSHRVRVGDAASPQHQPTHPGLTLSHSQLTRLADLFSKHQQPSIGDNIVGHAVDDRYPGQVKKGQALVPTGTVINGALDQDINSDYTGPWRGIITQDVYSIDNQFILFPKGTQVLGTSLHIANVNAPIQNRMGLTVDWMILPNGKRIDFRRQAVEDRTGLSGIGGEVNHHLLAQFTAVGAYALISASMPHDKTNALGVTQNPTFKGQFADGLRDQALPMVTKYLSLVPTVTLRAGTPIKIMIQSDIYSKPWARVNQTVYEDNYATR